MSQKGLHGSFLTKSESTVMKLIKVIGQGHNKETIFARVYMRKISFLKSSLRPSSKKISN
jgi:hypothetical protein